ncbi:hypothetical protein HJC23_002105 [Cyclotella cryptica]|uniref:Uncharacterized protein n=1 Tax=Cyclotella cryptica TaxID=29204 RepID=A0ABD3P8W4_9STRA
MSNDEYESERGSDVSTDWDDSCDVDILYSASDDNGSRFQGNNPGMELFHAKQGE